MIPDFPSQKAKLRELYTNFFRARYRKYLGFWGSIPARVHHEGSQWLLHRQDDTQDSGDYQEVSTMFSISMDEAPSLTMDQVLEKLDAAAKDMARQTSHDFFTSLNETLDEYGQTMDAEGRPFSKEMFLDLIDSVEIEFDRNGEPIMPALVIPPQLRESIKDQVQDWGDDPELSARHKEIMEKKKVAWRARENRRKLVD